jgi:hypothetical protein
MKNKKKVFFGVKHFTTWLKNDKERDSKIIDLWMQCYTQEQIAELVGIDHATTSRITNKFMQNGKSAKITKDFTPQLYNIWEFCKE